MPVKKPKPTLSEVAKPIGTIMVERSFTKNMGDFNSARVTVAVTVPIEHTPEELAGAMKVTQSVNNAVETFLEAELDRLSV
jgi:hypothetical protein